MFTKRHYKKVAEEINRIAKGCCSIEAQNTIVVVAHRLSIVFLQDNPQFDAKKFIIAGGIPEKWR